MSMCFSFHHLKVDFKDGNKFALMPPNLKMLRDYFSEWQEKMSDAGGWNAVFWCNHDQPRAVSRFCSDKTYWKQAAKMLALLIHFMRGTPYIFQGEEIGTPNAGFTSIDQYQDVESKNYYRILIDQGKTKEAALKILAERSRDNGRTPMLWDESENKGFSTSEPWLLQPIINENISVASQQEEDSILYFYKKLD